MNLYDIEVETMQGEMVKLEQFQGKVLVIFNSASQCGFTPQLKESEQLYRKYKERGLMVLGFPCNQFHGQEPGTNQEIASFCKQNYGVTFPMFSKIDVNGSKENPLFTF